MKFKKKPIVIEATQYKVDPVTGKFPTIPGVDCDSGTMPFCRTLGGPLRVSPNDWIITGVKGEVYPCKPDVFDITYDPVMVSEGNEVANYE